MAVVKCAIQLGIPDALEAHGGPATLLDLSSALGCSPSALHRVMRASNFWSWDSLKLCPSSSVLGNII
ncbi:hypothetical protein C3L33_20597, partial [Rhododendron williamsianum]